MKRSALTVAVAALALLGCGDSQSKIYGKWKQGPLVIEFSEKTVSLMGATFAVDRYEVKDGNVTVFAQKQPGLTFAFKSDKEMCIVGTADMQGCFTKLS
jgi:hypothetical protein